VKILLAIMVLGAALSGRGRSNPGFEELKKLEGTWQSTDKEHPAKVTFRCSVGGSVMVETMSLPDHPEMITMYHLDGEDLVLTHYCKLGNQPRMRAEKGQKPGVLRFTYDGGTNLKPNDMHMHALTVTIQDADHVKEEWTLFDAGKETAVVAIPLVRKKD
jgi:hypothetical protein